MSVFNGRASDIEDNRNKVSTIDENSTDKQYPSAKAVYNAMQSVRADYTIVANALKGTKSGTVVSVKDISPLQHDIKVKATLPPDVPTAGVEIIKGDIATAYNPVEPPVIPEGYIFINEDELTQDVEFDPKGCSKSVVFDEQHQKGFFTHIYEFEGQSVGAVLTDGENYYVLYLIDYLGGDVAAAIDGNKVYVQVKDGEIKEYTVTDDTTKNIAFYCIGNYGFGFSSETETYATVVDIYGCSVNVNATAVKVKVLGKNFFDVSRVKNDSYGRVVNNQDGTLTITAPTSSAVTTNGTPRTLKEYAPDLIVGQQYKLSLTTQGTKAIYLRNDGASYSTSWRSDRVFTLTENDLNADVYWYGAGAGVPTTISNIQIELGTVATEYEPYQGELTTYNVNADGSVDGVRSIYPSMTFMPDTEGVTLDVEYNRDINKAFAELSAAVISLGGNV